MRWYRFGDPLASAPPPRKTPEQRYRERVDRRGPDKCWPWTGAYATLDRGAFRWQGKTRIATRVGWEIEHGESPGNLHVCHTCDHGWCHNPRHWFLGTHQDNMTDLKEKNLPRGRPSVTTPEMDAEIDAALRSGESRRSIAARMGVSRDVINRHAMGHRVFVRAPAPQRQPPLRIDVPPPGGVGIAGRRDFGAWTAAPAGGLLSARPPTRTGRTRGRARGATRPSLRTTPGAGDSGSQ